LDAQAFVARRGDSQAGAIIIKTNDLAGGFRVFAPTTGLEGDRRWLCASGRDASPEETVDQYIAKQLSFDPDIWVLEIEDRDGRHFLEEPIEYL
jgi:hypothetical protein